MPKHHSPGETSSDCRLHPRGLGRGRSRTKHRHMHGPSGRQPHQNCALTSLCVEPVAHIRPKAVEGSHTQGRRPAPEPHCERQHLTQGRSGQGEREREKGTTRRSCTNKQTNVTPLHAPTHTQSKDPESPNPLQAKEKRQRRKTKKRL